jgi:peptidoglycan/LPS O-acetylase OafA/YrhL
MSGAAHGSTRFRALDGWRGLCALLVAAHHIEAHGWLYWQPLIRNAWLFVDFFFVLSGFVIAHAYGAVLSDLRAARDFARRRFARLWPLHAAMLAALIGLELVHLATAPGAFTGGRSPFAILTNLLLVQSLGLHGGDTWNGPAWSISVEFYTYLIFAAVCLLVRGRLRIAIAAALALGGAFILARFSRYGMRETFDWGIMRCLYGFFAGVLVYEAWRYGLRPRGTAFEGAAVILAIGFLTFVPGHRALEYLSVPVFAGVVLAFAGEGGALSRLLTTRPIAALGRWSYSIYMTHTLILALVFSAVPAPPTGLYGDLSLLAILAVTVGFSAITWRLIERPGQRFFATLPTARRHAT